MEFEGIQIEVTRKAIRSMRLSVKADGRVLLSVPLGVPEKQVEAFLLANRQWLLRSHKRMQDRLDKQVRLQYDTGEEHLLWGRLLPLRIEAETGRESVAFYDDEIVLYCHPDRTAEQRKKILYQGYYQQFRPVLDEMLSRWGTRLNEQNRGFFSRGDKYTGFEVTVRLMKTEWGSCMPKKKHMTFNVDMARLPKDCMEYVVVHELTHVDYCDHSPAFWALCDERLRSAGLADSKTMRARIKKVIRSCGGD